MASEAGTAGCRHFDPLSGRDDRECHEVDGATCQFKEKQELVENMQAAGLDVEPHFITKDDLDGKVFTSSGHALGNRTEIVFRVAGKYLEAGHTETSRTRSGPSDFERRDSLVTS
ncbi:MAG: hypothetical protein ACKVII_24255 [Planctomycetales bacterium]